jgi:glycosyltransferase involved in cell wall biosynthesis
MVKVSVLIPLYNSEKFIEEAVKSALGQSWINKEIIIVDDGSTDNSLSVAKSLESETVKVFSQPKHGASSARNLAFKYSTGDYIQYLDADDLLSDDKIEVQMKIAETENFDPAVLIFGKTAFIENDISDSILSSQAVNKTYNDPINLLIDLFSSVSFISLHAYLTHRDLIIRSGEWDEDLSVNDDGEFYSRVISHSKKVIYCDNGVSYYRRSLPNSLSNQNSPDHTLSEYLSIKKITETILRYNNTHRSKAACSHIFNLFIVDWFPRNKFILPDIERTMKQYGLNYFSSSPSKIYHYIQRVAGWRRALLFSEYYSKLKKKALG